MVTIQDYHQHFLKSHHINLSLLTQDAIEAAMCKKTVVLRPEIIKWIEEHHINLSLFINESVEKEMKQNGG